MAVFFVVNVFFFALFLPLTLMPLEFKNPVTISDCPTLASVFALFLISFSITSTGSQNMAPLLCITCGIVNLSARLTFGHPAKRPFGAFMKGL